MKKIFRLPALQTPFQRCFLLLFSVMILFPSEPILAQSQATGKSISASLTQLKLSQRPVWEIHLQKIGDPSQKDTLRSREQSAPQKQTIAGGERLLYPKLKGQGIRLTLDRIQTQPGTLTILPRLENSKPGWVITAFYGPVIEDIPADLAHYPLCMPVGLGQIYRRLPTATEPLDVLAQKGATPWKWIPQKKRYELISSDELGAPAYPSRFATMQWCAFSGASEGLYLASHDEGFAYKRFRVFYTPDQHMGFAFEHYFTCFPGTSVQLPPLNVHAYTGDWHRAAQIYRTWFDTQMQRRDIPEWIQQSSGWFLTILKQQNNQIMWNYADMGTKMAEHAQSRGLDIIGWFGWTTGGHDRFYPDYVPDPEMGGEPALKEAIAQLHRKGIRSILYANGQLMDQNGTDYWEKTGKQITVVKEDGKRYAQTWHKFSDAPARHHGMACLSTPEWYERLLSLALQANRLGADGILYDQLGVTAPCFCYAPHHGHSAPAVVYEKERYALLKRIADTLTGINPNFIVMTEGLCDVEFSSIALFHGYSNGVYVPSQKQLTEYVHQTAPTSIFPEMFAYTFPEKMLTIRNPSPVNNRLTLNYGTVFGLRSELESRYPADVRYLAENRVPLPSDYSNVLSKPNLDLVTGEDPVAMQKYTKEVIDFQRKYQRFLWNGTFTDQQEIAREETPQAFILTGDTAILAKSFVHKNETAILVWNTSDTQTLSFRLKAKPGFRWVESATPETAAEVHTPPATEFLHPSTPTFTLDPQPFTLKAQHLRLFVFTKE